MDKQYELKLASGKTVIFEGETPQDAARRFVDLFRDETVIAWRNYPRHGLIIGTKPIVETGGDKNV